MLMLLGILSNQKVKITQVDERWSSLPPVRLRILVLNRIYGLLVRGLLRVHPADSRVAYLLWRLVPADQRARVGGGTRRATGRGESSAKLWLRCVAAPSSIVGNAEVGARLLPNTS